MENLRRLADTFGADIEEFEASDEDVAAAGRSSLPAASGTLVFPGGWESGMGSPGSASGLRRRGCS